MAKIISRPAGRLSLPDYPQEEVEESVLAQSMITGGMVTALKAENLKNNQLALQKNFVTRFGKISRREGQVLLTPTKPDSNPVLTFVSFAKNDGTVKLIRLTPTTINSLESATWTPITSGSPIGGDEDDRFSTVVADDRFFFANNGVDTIQEIDTTANTYSQLGNAPEYKYITGFGDRIVGANLGGAMPNAIQVGWSGNLNYDEWSPLVDKTSGSIPLVDSSSDLADFISGIFGFDNTMQIIRERSIWEVSLTGAPTSPFNFYSKVPNIGSDCPWSIARIPFGLAFLDFRTREVYTSLLNGQLEGIGGPIINTLISQVNDPKKVFGSYNQKESEYSICLLDSTTSVVKAWTYSFIEKVWWYEEYINISSISDLDYLSGSLSIDELLGSIDQLVGDIDDLSPSSTSVTRFFGYNDGEITLSNELADDDAGTEFTSLAQSKVFTIPDEQTLVSRLRIDFTPQSSSGEFQIGYKRDNRAFVSVKTVSWNVGDIGESVITTFRKVINCRRYQWQVVTVSGLFEINNYEIKVSAEGESED
jgi:hypothetical protein